MKSIFYAFVVCVILVIFTFLLLNLKNPVPQYQPPEEIKTVTVATMQSVSFENCDIAITTSTGEKKIAGQLATSGSEQIDCILNPKHQISTSGKYLIFEDVSGGVDLWIRVYSIEAEQINTLGVLGTSSLLDLEFLDNDQVALLAGYPDIPNEQNLVIYDLPKLYKDYPNNLDEYGYFMYNLEASKKTLPIRPLAGNHFDLTKDSERLYLYGGDTNNPVKRNEFLLRDL
jgi:hypothetical protein